MSSRIRVFATSVGTKLLIGITGLALFLYLITHIAGNALVFLGPSTFNQYAHILLSNPLIPLIEVGLVLIFLIHVYKTVTMYLGNQQARPVGYAMKKTAGRLEPQDLRIVDDDLLRPLAARVHHHPRDDVQVRRGVPVGGRCAGSLSSRDGELQQPADRRPLRPQHARCRIAPVARRVEHVPVGRVRPSALDAPRPGDSARRWRSSSPADSSSSRCGRTWRIAGQVGL